MYASARRVARTSSSLVGRRVLRLEIHDEADRALRFGAINLDGRAVGAHEVVRRDRRLEQVSMSRGERAVQIAAVGHDPRLVERRPHRDAIAERAEHHPGVVGEPVGDVAVEPAAAVVERGRQVPVVERGVRRDAGLEQPIDEPAIEIETALVDRPGARGRMRLQEMLNRYAFSPSSRMSAMSSRQRR